MYCKILYSTLLLLMAIVGVSCAPTPLPLSEQQASKADQDTVKWQPCYQPEFAEWFPFYPPADTLQCAVIDVLVEPFTQSKDEATVIKLAVSRLPATGNSVQKLGTLISISGGPGQSGLDIYPTDSAAFSRLSRHFDIIGYAPRGVYPTTPTVKCSLVERVLHPEDPQDFVKGCWEHTPADLLSQLGADYSIDDIEAIRQAIAEPKISLISYSYGTKIAALYAEKYPEHLRAGVLDGVVNLNETDTQINLNQAASLQKTFERFVSQCHEQDDCYFFATSTIKQAEAKLAKLYNYIEANELYDYDEQRISSANMSWVFYSLLMWPDQWPLFNQLLLDIDNKDFRSLKIHIADEKNNIDYATFTAIICADGAPDAAQKASYIDDVKSIIAVSTWDSFRKFTDEEMLDACYYWPIKGSDTPHAPKLSTAAPPLLLVAQTDDFATPYANAVAMQKYLKSTLLTRQGDGHTLALSDTSRCVDNKVVDYLIGPNKIVTSTIEDENLYCAK